MNIERKKEKQPSPSLCEKDLKPPPLVFSSKLKNPFLALALPTMEAFSLLKYWRSGGGGNGGGGGAIDVSTKTTTTIATTVREMAATAAVEEEENSTTDEDDDEGPFFDLEFSVPDDEDAEEENQNDEENGGDDEDSGDDVIEEEGESVGGGTDGEPGFHFTVSPDSNGDGRNTSDTNNITFSPSDDLFFKGRLVPLEEPSSSSLLFNQSEFNKPPPQFPVSLLKTATKFRVFMLGFKKTKSESNGGGGGCSTSPEPLKPETQTQEQQQQQKQSKFFEVKFKVEEVPIISLFTRDNSSKNSTNKINKQQSSSSDEVNAALEEKKFSKDVVQKYLKMIKPLYVKVSKRYGEKMGFSGQLSLGSGKTAPTSMDGEKTEVSSSSSSEKTNAVNNVVHNKSQKQGGNLPGGFRVVRKHLGKSRSASSAVAAVTPVNSQAKRRDDSLLQQQDGIQSAILHCKRSFNASRDSDCCSSISRSNSNSSSREKSVDASRASFDEVIDH